jgi:predicted nucleotidyltransferase
MSVESILHWIVDEVSQVDGVRAIVLGGSRARGTNTPSSDFDIGIYYHHNSPLDLSHLRQVAARLDDERRENVITEIGGWGPWVNGGGWLRVQSYHVDFLYRDLEKVKTVIDDCLHEKVEVFYQPGHPFGFVSSIYLAEVAVCRPLWDPDGLVAQLKQKVEPYPDSLQKALIQKFAWEINFSIDIARKSAQRADVTYAAGCCFRSVMCMLQVLFAMNKQYWLNEKGAVALANTFEIKPAMLQSRMNEAFRLLDANPASIQKAIVTLEGLSKDIMTFIIAL